MSLEGHNHACLEYYDLDLEKVILNQINHCHCYDKSTQHENKWKVQSFLVTELKVLAYCPEPVLEPLTFKVLMVCPKESARSKHEE